jgi:hypothetical protein
MGLSFRQNFIDPVFAQYTARSGTHRYVQLYHGIRFKVKLVDEDN